MKHVKEYAMVFATGGIGYTLVELLWRGYSHWTMTLTGGACLTFIYINEKVHGYAPVWKKCLAGSLFISTSELVVGFFVNIVLKWNVWDYSKQFFNLFGQVCPLYSGLWFLLCFPVIYLCRFMNNILVPLEKTAQKQ